MEWISVDEQLPELINVWRTSHPLYVMVKNHGVSLAYPSKWMEEPFYWLRANIMCNENQEYAPVDKDNHIIGVTHWMPLPAPPQEHSHA